MVLDVEGLRFERGGVPGGDAGFTMSVDSLRLDRGDVVGVVGPSGCGKSTLIDLLALLRRPSAVKRFVLQQVDVAGLWQRKAADACAGLRASHVGVVLQTGGLLPSLPVKENVLLAQRLLGRIDLGWVDSLLRALDLAPLAARLPSQLSIGQRQRVAIARALAHRPSLVLADEPTASLGIDHAPAAMDLLLSLARDSGSALLIVSHDIELLQRRGVPLRRCVAEGAMVRLEAA